MAEDEGKKKGKKDGVKIGAIIILVLSAIVFIPVGGSAVMQSFSAKDDTLVFGKYRGKKIEYKAGTEFASTVTTLATQYQRMGYDVNSLSNAIFEQAFNGYVQNLYYRDALSKAGYAVSKEAVNREMVSYFTDENGNFSRKIYSEANQSDKDELRSSIEKDLLQKRYTDDLFGVDYGEGRNFLGLKASSKESPFIARMDAEKHSFIVTSYTTDDLPREEVERFVKDNGELFEKYDFSAVTLSSQSELQTLLKRIQANEITFEDAVSQKSEKLFTEDDGKLSSPYYFQLRSTLSDSDYLQTLTSLSSGEYSAVVPTVRGYTLFRCDGPKSAINLDDADSFDAALNYIKTNERGFIENYYIGLANDFIKDATSMPEAYLQKFEDSGAILVDETDPAIARRIAEGDETLVKISGFENACIKHAISSDDATAFPINYGNNSLLTSMSDAGGVLSSLTYDENALETLFSLRVNQVSSPFVLNDLIVVAKCTGIQTDEVSEIPSYSSSIYYDEFQNSSNTILNSPELENNLYGALIEMMLGRQ